MTHMDDAARRQWVRESAERLAGGQNVVWKVPGVSLRGVTRQQLFDRLRESPDFVDLAAQWADMVLAGVPADDITRQQLRADLHQMAVAVGIELLAPLADDYAAWAAEYGQHQQQRGFQHELCH